MLESNAFAIRKHTHGYELRSPATGELVGLALEPIGRFGLLLRRLLGSNRIGGRLEIQEKPDDSLVFTVEQTGRLAGSPFEVRDSLAVLVGYFTGANSAGGVSIFDKTNQRFSVLSSKAGDNYRWVSADGSAELGSISGVATDGSGDYLLQMEPELAEQPLAKMLLLGSALMVLAGS